MAEWAEWIEAAPDVAEPGQNETESDEAEPDALLAALEEATAARATWEANVTLKNWEDQPDSQPAVESSGFFRQMFLGNLGAKRRP